MVLADKMFPALERLKGGARTCTQLPAEMAVRIMILCIAPCSLIQIFPLFVLFLSCARDGVRKHEGAPTARPACLPALDTAGVKGNPASGVPTLGQCV